MPPIPGRHLPCPVGLHQLAGVHSILPPFRTKKRGQLFCAHFGW